VTYLTILGKENKVQMWRLFFWHFTPKICELFSENLRIMCQNILTLFYFWWNFLNCNLRVEKYQSGPRRKGNSTREVSQRMDGWMDRCMYNPKMDGNWEPCYYRIVEGGNSFLDFARVQNFTQIFMDCPGRFQGSKSQCWAVL